MQIAFLGGKQEKAREADELLSFVGGREAHWLAAGVNVRCDGCKEEMRLVTQVHAPLGATRLRCLLVYVCSGECAAQEPGKWQVWRVQKEEEEHEQKGEEKTRAMMSFGGSGGGAGAAPAMFAVPLWGEEEDAGHGVKEEQQPRLQEQGETLTELNARWLEFVMERVKQDSSLKKKKYRNASKEDSTWGGEQYERAQDERFLKLKDALARHPQQVMRYRFGGKPLWVSDPKDLCTPRCVCGAERVFELQLLSTLVYLTEDDEFLSLRLPDFGVACVFACSKSCQIDGKAKREIIHVQKSL